MGGMTALIPARGGSKGVPRKNITLVAGFPLIAYSIVACKMSKRIDRVVVSTDDEEIASVAKRYGAEVPFIRPKKYATDAATDFDVIKHFIEHQSPFGDFLAYMRPTTPIRDPAVLDDMIEEFLSKKDNTTSARSAHELPESPYKCYKIEDGCFKGLFDDFNGVKNYSNLPRQSFPRTYQPNGYVDIIKTRNISKGDIFGERVYPLITEHTLEVDTLYQLEMIKTHLPRDGAIYKQLLKIADSLGESRLTWEMWHGNRTSKSERDSQWRVLYDKD